MSDSANAWDPKKFKKADEKELLKKLDPLQFQVTQHEGTERAFSNAYWNNHEAGLYVDVVSGEPLFFSQDKYDSGTGWPSFTKPVNPDAVTLQQDKNLMLGSRTEVKSRHARSHLGHVFDDGPQPTGKRFCMNSASLKFVPAKDLEKEGYGEFKKFFEEVEGKIKK